LKYPKELYLGVNSHGDGGLITISDKKDWETEAQNAILVISLNAATFPVEESSTNTSEKNFPITELEKKLNLDIKSNFQGDPPWGWFNISIPLKNKSKFLNFNIRISNLDDVGYGGNNKYIKLASDILSTFKFTEPTAQTNWQSLIPEIRIALKKAFPNEHIEDSRPLSISSTNSNTPVQLVNLGTGGATTDIVAFIRMENNKIIIPLFKQKDGKVSTLTFSAGAGGSGRYGSTAVIIENGNAVYSASYSKYGDNSDYCRVEAYRWNNQTKIFEFNTELSTTIQKDYCNKAGN